MLRPGGWRLTSSAAPVSSPLATVPGLATRVVFERQGQMGDQIFVYRRP